MTNMETKIESYEVRKVQRKIENSKMKRETLELLIELYTKKVGDDIKILELYSKELDKKIAKLERRKK